MPKLFLGRSHVDGLFEADSRFPPAGAQKKTGPITIVISPV
jgi:hypothetical protein